MFPSQLKIVEDSDSKERRYSNEEKTLNDQWSSLPKNLLILTVYR